MGIYLCAERCVWLTRWCVPPQQELKLSAIDIGRSRKREQLERELAAIASMCSSAGLWSATPYRSGEEAPPLLASTSPNPAYLSSYPSWCMLILDV